MNDVHPLLRGVLFAHAGIAVALVEAVEHITGIQGALAALSNQEGSPEVLGARLSELLGDGPAIVFTDLKASSCSVLAARVCRQAGSRAVISGVNLGMLLDFVFHRDLPMDDLITRLVENGRASVQAIQPGGPNARDLPS